MSILKQMQSAQVVHNLAALPEGWTDRYDVAILCRALWSQDYTKARA